MFGFVGAPLPGRARCQRLPLRQSAATCSATAAVETHDLDGLKIKGPLKPVGHHIFVKVAKPAETTSGGLILSGGAKDKPTHGTAVAVGPGKYFPAGGLIPMAVSEGDTVMFSRFGNQDIKFDGEKHTLIPQDDVLCLLEGGALEASAVRPIHDRLLVKLDKPAEELDSGILLSTGGADKPTSGEVIAIGTGRVMENGEIEPLPVKAGDKVLYGQYAGTEIKLGDEEYIVIRVSDIYAHWSA